LRTAAYIAGAALAALLLAPLLFPPQGHGGPDLLTPVVLLGIPFLVLYSARIAHWLVTGWIAMLGFGWTRGKQHATRQWEDENDREAPRK